MVSNIIGFGFLIDSFFNNYDTVTFTILGNVMTDTENW